MFLLLWIKYPLVLYSVKNCEMNDQIFIFLNGN